MKSFLSIGVVGLLFASCGGTSETSNSDREVFQVSSTGGSVYLRALDPLFLAYARSCPGNSDPNTCNTLVPVTSQFNMSTLSGYDAVIQPELSIDRTTANSVITGIGMEAIDYQTGGQYKLTLGVVGRQFDFANGVFLNNFRIFAAPGSSFDGAQDFSIRNAISDNIFMTGLGVSLRGGTITKLELQRKSLTNLGKRGQDLTAANQVILDNGWAAVGFLLRVSPRAGSTSIPFLQEVLMFTAQLTTE